MITKRTTAPKFWPIKRKTKKYIISTLPGPHPKKNSMPLGVILRNVLKHAENLKEAKFILNKKMVKVDGKIRKDYKFPVGVMDILKIGQENYKVMPNKKGLFLKPIEETNTKLLKLKNKTFVKGKLQLNFYDGKNILSDKKDYKPGDTIVYDIQSKKLTDHFKMEKGSQAIIVEGKNKGTIGKIKEIKKTFGSEPNQIILQSEKQNLTVPQDYIFVIGE